MIENIQITEKTQRAARPETWAQYLSVPTKYIREKLRVVTSTASGIDREGKAHINKYYEERDVAQNVPEYETVREFERIGKNREEIRGAILRLVLEKNGYKDRRSLQQESGMTLIAKEYAPYGKGTSFYRFVTGEKIVGNAGDCFLQIADVLQLPELCEERKHELRELLVSAGFYDRRVLQLGSIKNFRNTDFASYGKGKQFYGWVTGNLLGEKEHLNRQHLLEVAQSLSLPEFSNLHKQQLCRVLEEAGYPDRRSLEKAQMSDFLSQDFGTYGKGKNFYIWSTGKFSKGSLAREHLLEMSDALELPVLSQKTLQEIRQIVIDCGYIDCRGLKFTRPPKFSAEKFGKFGSGVQLYCWATGITQKAENYVLCREELLHLAKVLQLPDISDQRIEEIRNLVITAGYPDRRSMLLETPASFMQQSFGTYGNGTDVYRWLTGDYLNGATGCPGFAKEHMSIIADILGLPDFALSHKLELLEALKKEGYMDKRSLDIVNPHIFSQKRFGNFSARELYLWTTGKYSGKSANLTKNQLMEMAEILALPDLANERQLKMQSLLISAGYPNLQTIRKEIPRRFREKDFGPYGKVAGFYRWVTGEIIHGGTTGITKDHMIRVGIILNLPAE